MQRSVCVLRWVVLFTTLLLGLVARNVLANVPVFLNSWGGSGSSGGQFNNPTGIALGSDGDVFVVDSYNNRVQRFDAYGNYETQWGALGSGPGQLDSPWGIAVNSSGQVYVADSDNVRIQRFDSNGTFQDEWGYGEFYYPAGVAVSSNGQVYIADGSLNRVLRFDAEGNPEGYWGSYGTGPGQFNWPVGVAVDNSGQVYAADTQNERIQRFDEWGAYQLQWGSDGSGDGQFSAPRGVAVSANDLVYVADTNNHRIQRFDSTGNYHIQWGSSGSGNGQFNWPNAVAVSDTGLVYIVDGNNRVQRFFDYTAWVNPATHYLPDSIEFDSDFTLSNGKALSVPGTTTVTSSWLRVEGGTLAANNINLIDGVLYYQSGVLEFGNLNAGMLFVGSGSPLLISTGMTARPQDVIVDVDATLIMAGGEAMANSSVSIGTGGSVLVSAGRFGAYGYFYNSGNLQLDNALLARVSSPIVDNAGILRGSGLVDGVLLNNGEVRVSAGEHLRIARSGAGHENSGLIEAIGNLQYGGPAELEFADHLVNHSGTGLIAARNATLRIRGGLDNQGSLAFSFGTSDVFGDVTNSGNISVLGGAEVTFYDDVTAAGGTLVISELGSTTSKVVMLGSYSGGFSGGGELYALGDLRPGSSPGAVTMGGDLFLGDSTNTLIEIGGLTAGRLYDTIDVTGDAALDGSLIVSLVDPRGGGDVFVPKAGDAFEILTAGELLGTFDSESFPAIPGKPGLEWLIDYDTVADTVLLTVAPIFGADFDEDGDVDGDDLTAWQAGYGIGTLHTQGDADLDGDVDGRDFLTWQRQYGGSLPLGATAGLPSSAIAVVPEPRTLLLALAFVVSLCLRWIDNRFQSTWSPNVRSQR